MSHRDAFGKKRKMKKIILLGAVIIVLGLTGAFFGIKAWIKADANEFANNAVQVFEKDKVESLIALIDSEDYTIKEKNRAVWALGVLKDESALPKLEALLTDTECNHDESICQYELKKAILKIKGEFKGSWQVSD